jgi:hypothetical protein
LHPEKESAPRNSTDGGRQIDLNEIYFANDLLSISYSPDFDSKTINSTDDNSPLEESLPSGNIRVIMRGMTRLRTLAAPEIETDKNRT